jgi:CRISPR-associated protein Csd1
MLSALVEAARRFRAEGKLAPRGYKLKQANWIIGFRDGRPHVEGPYTRKEVRQIAAPDRERSGTASEDNRKPFLLMDDARYVLGKTGDGKDAETRLLHSAYIELLNDAWRTTNSKDLKTIVHFLQGSRSELAGHDIGAKHKIAFQVEGKFPTDSEAIQDFWVEHLRGKYATGGESSCCVCGCQAQMVRILPRRVGIIRDNCPITSFNEPAFWSLGKKKTANAPLCFDCALDVTDALEHFVKQERHSRIVLSIANKSTGQLDSLRSQLAVFWLKQPVEVVSGATVLNFEDLLPGFLERAAEPKAPPPLLSQLEALLEVPWTGREASLALADNRFYLALLSGNKGRLVVREWLDVSLDRVKRNLKRFLDASLIVGPWGEQPRAFPIPAFLTALASDPRRSRRDRTAVASENPNLSRSLLRTAFQGHPPPHGLMEAALSRLRIPNVLANADLLHPLAALLKLTLTHRTGEASKMERVDDGRTSEAYLCGRLLAVIAEAQRRASRNLGTTLVERFYGATSTAPKAYLGLLLKLTATAYLPKLRKEGGYHAVIAALEAVTANSRLTPETLPTSLSLTEQAEFALGFYHQQADFRAQRAARAKRPNTQAGDQK